MPRPVSGSGLTELLPKLLERHNCWCGTWLNWRALHKLKTEKMGNEPHGEPEGEGVGEGDGEIELVAEREGDVENEGDGEADAEDEVDAEDESDVEDERVVEDEYDREG